MADSKRAPTVLVHMAGFGTVGRGVFELLLKKNLAGGVGNDGAQFKFASILVRNQEGHIKSLKEDTNLMQLVGEDADLDALFTTDSTAFQTALESNPIEADQQKLLVELIGGTSLAKSLMMATLSQQIGVVTANKALLAESLQEINAAIMEKDSNKAHSFLGFEAAVCGGIPIIRSLLTDFECDKVSRLSGILNGTTNFILSRMEADLSLKYSDVLKEAQDLGYAEADPTADVEGHDACAKLEIMANLAMGLVINKKSEEVSCRGISKVTAFDFVAAREKMDKGTVRVCGVAEDNGDNTVGCFVAPCLVASGSSPLAACTGPTNLVSVSTANLGEFSMRGPGAGRFPTANSVVNDVTRFARRTPYGPAANKSSGWSQPFRTGRGSKTLSKGFSSTKWYVRFSGVDNPGAVSNLWKKSEAKNLSLLHEDGKSAAFILETEKKEAITEAALTEQVAMVCMSLSLSADDALWMPVV